ncbi:MAG: hypothetical protein ACQESQ_08870 [Bacteroidota bacterium]
MEQVKINQKEYPINFGFNGIRKFCDETNIPLQNLEKAIVNHVNYAMLAIYIAISEGYRKQKKDFDITIDEFTDMFDADPDALERVIKIMARQMQSVMENSTKKNKKPPKK